MKIELKKYEASLIDLIIYPCFDGDKAARNKLVHDEIGQLIKWDRITGKYNELFYFNKLSEGKMVEVIIIGLGKKEDITQDKIKNAIGKVARKCVELKVKNVYVSIADFIGVSELDVVKSLIEGFYFGSYKFDKYLTKKEKNNFNVFLGDYDIENKKFIKDIVAETKDIVESTILAMDIVNEPSNIIYPEELARICKKTGEKSGFEVEVLNKKEIEKLKMAAFLEVAKGSEKSPRLIIMRYKGNDNSNEILGLVGKGLTYDSGGYSIKQTNSMYRMNTDMAGSAAVLGAMSAIAKRKVKVNVIAVIAACENLISGNSYKPGDIIGSMAEKTIEVLNTDAEGRLTLADAIHYIIDIEKVTKVIDIATLTGAAVIALGNYVTPCVTNNQEFYNKLKKAAALSGEKIWELPADDDYKELIKSDVADLKNVGGKAAGTITAALFVGEFTKGIPWIHMDIAGTCYIEKATGYYPKGATGAGVRILYNMAKE